MDSIQVVSENDELELSNLIDINFEIIFFKKIIMIFSGYFC